MTGYAVPFVIVLFGSIVAPRPGSSVAGDAYEPCAAASVGESSFELLPNTFPPFSLFIP